MTTKVLAVAVAFFAALALVLGGLLLSAKLDLAEKEAQMATAHYVNASNQTLIEDLNRQNSAMVSKIAADLAAAELAQEQYTALELKYTSLELQNETIRDELADKDPETAAWLYAGMDRAVACSLWQHEALCSN